MQNQSCLVLLLATAALASTTTAQTSRVVPAANAKVEGSTMSVYPFGYLNPRTQQVWRGSAITSSLALIDGMQMRADAPRKASMPGRSYAKVILQMGATTVSPTTMSTTFASNITSTLTTVVSGGLNLPTQPILATAPSNFNIIFSWKQALVFSSTSGHLIADLTLPGPVGKSNYFVDAAVSTGSSPGGATAFGSSGAFSSPESFSLRANPKTLVPGGTLDLSCGSFSKAYQGNLMFSLSNTAWGAVPLPYDLAAIGAPKNYLYVGMDVVQGFNTAGAGNSSSFRSPIPNQQAFYGLTFYTQAYYVDLKANSAGIVASHGLAMTISKTPAPVTNQLGHYDNTSKIGNFPYRSSWGGAVVRFTGILP